VTVRVVWCSVPAARVLIRAVYVTQKKKLQ